MDTVFWVLLVCLLLAFVAAVAVLASRLSSLGSALKEREAALNESESALKAAEAAVAAGEMKMRLMDEHFAALSEEREKTFESERKQMKESVAAKEAEIKLRESQFASLSKEREHTFETMKKQMEESFRLLSEQNLTGLRRQNAESIGEILKPIQEKFGEFDKTVKSSQEKSVAQEASLKELLQHLIEQSKSVGDEARNLADALKGRSKLQGDFGEMLLVDLLKKSGLQEGVHFTAQGVLTDEMGHEIKNEEGGRMIPDVVVCYPDDTEVVIDAKISLTAYAEYVNATDPEERERYARKHIDSIRAHVNELKNKNYASYVPEGKKKIDYNIMFIPVEGAYLLMLEKAPTLWQLAKDANVLIAGQMNLMIVLNLIMMMWKQHDRQKNIEQVYEAASELMSQLKGWMDSYVRLGEHIDKASSAYAESRKKLVDSNQSVVRKIDKLERLHVGPKRSRGKINPNARMVAGRESVIPKALAEGLDMEEDMETTDNTEI